jgi:L-alanine-DL-glutamate epimerase-like enolase superfamily enzyme
MERRDFLKTSFGAALLLGIEPGNIAAAGLKVSPDNKELSLHKLDRIKFTQIKLSYPRQVGRNSIKGIHGFGPNSTVATLYTDKGASGWGLLRSNAKDSEAAFSTMKGKPLTDFFSVESGVINDLGKSFDIPFHDLAGNILNKPVYKLLGGKKPQTAPCYSGMIYFDDLDQPDKTSGLDKLLEECRYDRDFGYRQLKVKIGRGNKWMPPAEGLQRDIEVTKLIVSSFPDCQVLVDGNDGFNPDGIIEYLKGIGDIPLFWVEEPFLETEEGYRKLRSWTTANGNVKYLADGEANPDIDLVTRLEDSKLIDICLLDIMGFGFTPWRKMMPVLKKKKILASPHNWGDFMKTVYTVQLTGALGNTATIEGVTCFSDDVDFGDYKLAGGRYTPSDAPGFGMKLLKG